MYQIVDGLYLGNLPDSLNADALRENRITLVVSAIKGLPAYPYASMVRALLLRRYSVAFAFSSACVCERVRASSSRHTPV